MKLIYLTSRFPYPINKGDKLRSYFQIKELSKFYEIHLISLTEKNINDIDIEKLSVYCKSINIYKMRLISRAFNLCKTFFNNKPFQVNYFYHNSIQKKINKNIKLINPDHIFCQLIRTAMYIKNNHSITKTLDYMDAFSKGMERRVNVSSFWIKPIVRMESYRLRKFENLAFEFFNNHLIISEYDRDEIVHPKKEQIKIIENGIDESFLSKNDIEIKYDLVFVGNLSYVPNIEAANFILKQILPKLLKIKPNIKILIAGSDPTKKIMNFSNKNIYVKGWVNDIRDVYCSGKIFFAPMSIGSGLQNKLLEAMALGIPCITSKLSNFSLGATHMENIIIGDSINDFINQIVFLLEDEKARVKIGLNGKKYVIENYNWKISNLKLLELLKSKQNI
jgi:glycosyltransferase involved in cell wall biosynthesis